MKIIKQRERHSRKTYALEYSYVTDSGCGFTFDCDKDGKVFVEKFHPSALENYNECLTGYIIHDDGTKHEVVCEGIRTYSNSWTDPAVGECIYCKEHVTLYGFTNTCECGADYNMSGQLLACREQWGEETGEHWSDCL